MYIDQKDPSINSEDFTDEELKEIVVTPISELVEGIVPASKKEVEEVISTPKPILQLNEDEDNWAVEDLEEMGGEPLLSDDRYSIRKIDANDFPDFVESPLADKIGSEREKAFREVGEGSGEEVDFEPKIDGIYGHLVYKNKSKLGGYRFIFWKDMIKKPGGIEKSYNATLYKFSDNFKKNRAPKILELTRMYGGPRALRYCLAALQQLAADRRNEGDLECDEMAGSATISSHFKEPLQRELVYFMENEIPIATEIDLKPGDITPKNPEDQIIITDAEKAAFSKKYKGLSLKDKFQEIRAVFRKSGQRFPDLFEVYPDLAEEGYVTFICAVKNPKRSCNNEKINYDNPSIEMFLIVKLDGIKKSVDEAHQSYGADPILETFQEEEK
jgi:hypothetical protein